MSGNNRSCSCWLCGKKLINEFKKPLCVKTWRGFFYMDILNKMWYSILGGRCKYGYAKVKEHDFTR